MENAKKIFLYLICFLLLAMGISMLPSYVGRAVSCFALLICPARLARRLVEEIRSILSDRLTWILFLIVYILCLPMTDIVLGWKSMNGLWSGIFQWFRYALDLL